VISAQKAYTANAFSLPGLALSTANLYNLVQPGNFLYGLQFSNPVDPTVAYAGPAGAWGTAQDPLVGNRAGGINVFGGGLALYDQNGQLVGGLGVSGDSACADHIIAWKLRDTLGLDFVSSGVSPTGDDNIIFGLDNAYGHPECGLGELEIAPNLPTTHPISQAGQTVTEVVAFDAAAGELPEGIAVDAQNTVYVGLAPIGEIRTISPTGEVATYATLPDPGEGNMTGLALDAAGRLYVALAGSTPDSNGLFLVSKGGASVERLAGFEVGSFPNGIAFDAAGNTYVTDSSGGRIWRVDPTGNATVWAEGDLLAGQRFGANGVVLDEAGANFYVANTEAGHIARIPLQADGTAGTAEVFVADKRLVGADGLTFGPDGNLYVAVNGQDAIVRVSPEGEITVVAQGGILQNPASLAFGSGDQAGTLYITNAAFGRSTEEAAPGVVSIQVQ
jgi:sugar lactone lactonase YvrE/uncharacterized protein GlcG (DUF336 family)